MNLREASKIKSNANIEEEEQGPRLDGSKPQIII